MLSMYGTVTGLLRNVMKATGKNELRHCEGCGLVPVLAAAWAELAATPAARTQALLAALMEAVFGPDGLRCTRDCTSCSTGHSRSTSALRVPLS